MGKAPIKDSKDSSKRSKKPLHKDRMGRIIAALRDNLLRRKTHNLHIKQRKKNNEEES